MPKKAHWYTPLRLLQSKGSSTVNVGGLAGIAAARQQHQGQFFTPDEVVRVVWALLQPTMAAGLHAYHTRFSLFDNSFGSGRLFQFADPAVHTLVGIEADAELAAEVQATVAGAGFACALETGSMTEFRPDGKEYNIGIINPPFSLHFDGPEVYPFEFNSHGRYGEKSSAVSHKYALGQALRCCQVVAAILPRPFIEELKRDEFFAFSLAGVYHLPKGAFLSEGADWPISIALFGYALNNPHGGYGTVRNVNGVRRLHPDAPEVELKPGESPEGPALYAVNTAYRKDGDKLAIPRYKCDPTTPFSKLPVTGSRVVRVCHSGRKVFLGFDCAVAHVRVMNRVHRDDYSVTRPNYPHDRVPVGLESEGQGQLDLEAYLMQKDPVAAWNGFLRDIRSWGYKVEADPGIANYLRRRARRDALIRVPFRHTALMGKDRGLSHWLSGREKVRWQCVKECTIERSMYGKEVTRVGEVFTAEPIGLKWTFDAKKSEKAGRRWDRTAVLAHDVMLEHFRPVEFKERDGWVVIHEGLAASHPQQFDEAMARARALGLDKWCTWDFQLYDLVELSMKGLGVAAWEMGLGKARLLLALAMLGGKRNAIIVEAHLVEEMVAECKVLGISPEVYRVFDTDRQVDKSKLCRINIFSYNRAKTDVLRRDGTKAAPGLTFAKRLRGMFNTVCCDEGHLLRNSTTDQSLAVFALKGKRRFVATGTPITNYCRDILPVIQWVGGCATAVQPYGRTPGAHRRRNTPTCAHLFLQEETLANAAGSLRGIDVFRTKFSVFEWVTNEFAEDMVDGAKREVPKIADVIGFRRFIAPFVKRRVMEEPDVARYVRVPKPELKVHTLKWDLGHLTHYVQIAREFAEWYKKLSEWDKSRNLVLILAKIQAIIRACNFPQDESLAGRFHGMTSKQKFALDLMKRRVVDEGRKTMLAANSPDLLNFLSAEATRMGIPHVVFHGGVSVAKRNKALYREFRDGPVNLLLCSNGCMQTGYNLPQVSAIIATDRAWTPKIEKQRNARALRPQQKQTVLIDVLHLEGSIDEYQGQMCDMKAASMLAGLDYGADDEDEKDFVHMDHILGRFVEELEAKLGTTLDVLINQKKKGRA